MACREGIEAWLANLTAAIARGHADGSVVNRKHEPRALAVMAASIWQGSLLLTKTLQDQQHVKTALGGLFTCLFGD